MKNKLLIIIGLFLLFSSCSQRYCLQKYPPEESYDSTISIVESKIPVIIPGKNIIFPVFVDCDTIIDTMTIYKNLIIPNDTIEITKIDTIKVFKESKVQIVEKKNPINKVLSGIAIGLFLIIVTSLLLIVKKV